MLSQGCITRSPAVNTITVTVNHAVTEDRQGISVEFRAENPPLVENLALNEGGVFGVFEVFGQNFGNFWSKIALEISP